MAVTRAKFLWQKQWLKNPVDFLQFKTDYTPTGSEPVGTTYWDNWYPVWITENWKQSILKETFETLSKNLKAVDGVVTYTDWLPTVISYWGIVKTITYTDWLPTVISIVSWDKTYTKNIVYTDWLPTSFTYLIA